MELPQIYKDLSWSDKKLCRELYTLEQDNRCWLCGSHLDDKPSKVYRGYTIHEGRFPSKFFDYPIHLHHDHIIGLTIGVVHAHCNAYLWQYENQ